MTSGIFVNFAGVTCPLVVDLYDFGVLGECVWRVVVGSDVRFVEGFVNDEVWSVIELAVRAYDVEV